MYVCNVMYIHTYIHNIIQLLSRSFPNFKSCCAAALSLRAHRPLHNRLRLRNVGPNHVVDLVQYGSFYSIYSFGVLFVGVFIVRASLFWV